MIFRQLYDADSFTYTYLLADPHTREAVIIDSVAEQLERDLQLVEELGLQLVYALDTHIHADHITGAGPLRKRTGCTTAISRHAPVDCADIQLGEGDYVAFGHYRLQVLETPGHTDTCLSFVGPGMVFTGDALFIRGGGRTDFQAGDADTLYQSVTGKLFSLDVATDVYPGHDYRGHTVSTIGEEKRLNPRFNLGREGFISFMNNLDLPQPKRIQEALPANMACGERGEPGQ